MTYSTHFRKKVLNIRKKENLSFEKLAKRFGIGKNTIARWSQRLQPKTTRSKPTSKIHNDLIKADVEKYPDSYQYERAKRLGVSKSGIWCALKRNNLTYKKNSKTPKSL